MSDSKKTTEELLLEAAHALFFQEDRSYTVAQLLPRFKLAADENRTDSTINQVTYVLEQANSKDPTIEVTAQDLKDLSNQFYTSSTNFNNEFADLLETQEESIQKQASRITASGEASDLSWDGAHEKAESDTYSQDASEDLIDNQLSYTPEDLKLAHYASMLISDELRATGKVKKASSVLKYRNEDMLLFQTKFKTASSEVEVFIPVEIKNETPLFPQVMSTTEKVYTLDTQGVESLTLDIERTARLKKANQATSLRTAEEFEIALRDDSIGKYAEEVSEYDIETPTQVSLGHDEIENILKQAVLTKESKFTKSAHADGRELVEVSLAELGFKNPQVKFDGDSENGLKYTASVNTEVGKITFSVPVEIRRASMLPPYQFSVDGQTYDFSKEAILHFAKIARASSSLHEEVNPLLFTMSYPDLRKHLKAAAHHKNHKLAQEIITFVDEKFGDYYRNAATDDYQTWLEDSVSTSESRCAGCDHYNPKTAHSHNDYCNLIKTASKNVQKDAETGICTRSTYADSESEESTYLDSGSSIRISWND